MTYKIEAVFHQGGDNEFSWHDTVDTLEAAVKRINHWASGNVCRAWINNKEVQVRNGHVLGCDGELFCTNPVWHENFAPLSYPRIITNPATYRDIGEPL